MKFRSSILLSGLFNGYPGASKEPISRWEGEKSVEEEDSDATEVRASLADSNEFSKAPNIALPNQTIILQAETNYLKMMEKMTQSMGQLTQEVSPRNNPRAPEPKPESMKSPVSL
ncbi:hypothetical protein O181_104668 [Austropuccinia psidii MF-1]|uniref:Uncharacterized protein n=1 Tax=Austropuccinia psidii MF-1 TaxID=1389203 RepID=A0A9Q3JKK9_9BASI|nr:hypothetical protein [Austropuccinia psidii MF-1]